MIVVLCLGDEKSMSEEKIQKNLKINNYLNVLEILSKSTDDFLFLFNVEKDEVYFFGNVSKDYTLCDKGSTTISSENVRDIVHEADKKALEMEFYDIVSGKKTVHDMEYRWINRQGDVVWVNCRGTVISDEDGNPFVMIGRVSEEALRHLFNPLTGLFNKIRMKEDLRSKKLSTNNGYLMLVDVDNLTAINFSHGRAYGDNVLKTLAKVLEDIPLKRKVYHVDYNYFALYIDAKDENEVREIYAHIQSSMSGMCTVSSGVLPLRKGMYKDEYSLYDSAKLTLRKAKSKGKNTIEFFSEEEIKSKVYSVELLEELSESVNNNCKGFYLDYQPQVMAGSYKLFGIEALLRYNSKTRGKVFPDEFIPILEQSRLINEVGMWVLETALLQCKKWREALPDLRVSVNFSTVQFKEDDIVENVLTVLKKTQMPGNSLTIEITESVSLNEIEHLSNVIKLLKIAGIQIAIDDFGTGYSNIGYLKKLDVDEIKVDRLFVKDVKEDTYNYRIISNTIDFAKMNSIRVCCEGVEDTRELMVLEELSSDILQGYLFDKPCEPKKIESTYFDNSSQEYSNRTKFVEDLYRHKEKMGVVHFEAKDILRKTGVGLWVIRINKEENCYEMYADATLERIMGADKKYTSQEFYSYWLDRVKNDYLEYVKENTQNMIETDKLVRLEYLWKHPELGEVTVSSCGKRTVDSDSMVVLEGYCNINN